MRNTSSRLIKFDEFIHFREPCLAMKHFLSVFNILPILLMSSTISQSATAQSVTDIDGNTYSTVVVGPYEWMAENLRTTRFNNGDEIPQVVDYNTWETTEQPAWNWYNNNVTLDQLYGKLYIGWVVLDERNVCPEGWRVPTDFEWRQTLYSLCETSDCEEVWLESDPQSGWTGTDEGGKTKSTSYWDSPNTGADNSSGLTVLPGGYRYFDGNYYTFGFYTNLWTSTMHPDSINMWFWAPINDRADIYHGYGDPNNGQSIRCIRNATTGKESHTSTPLQLFPNPTRDKLRFSKTEADVHEVVIYNAFGQALRRERLSPNQTSIDVSDLPAGLYLLELRSERTTTTARWLKQ